MNSLEYRQGLKRLRSESDRLTRHRVANKSLLYERGLLALSKSVHPLARTSSAPAPSQKFTDSIPLAGLFEGLLNLEGMRSLSSLCGPACEDSSTESFGVVAYEQGLSAIGAVLAALRRREDLQNVILFKDALFKLAAEIDLLKEGGRWREPSFNIFDVLGFPHKRLELIHSNILAWLFDRNKAHNMGMDFLRGFLHQFFGLKLGKKERIWISPEHQEGEDRPDIIVEGNHWLLLIENKVDSSEGPNQSRRYYDRWSRRLGKRKTLCFAWITPDGWQPECPHFKAISYSEITGLLEKMTLRGDASLFVQHFITHISQNLGAS